MKDPILLTITEKGIDQIANINSWNCDKLSSSKNSAFHSTGLPVSDRCCRCTISDGLFKRFLFLAASSTYRIHVNSPSQQSRFNWYSSMKEFPHEDFQFGRSFDLPQLSPHSMVLIFI
ncbi:hypothetical protein DITRI_Ditri09bG0069700 [Diplodiscus trichospermus]